jgi:two-component sensor histidine kinase
MLTIEATQALGLALHELATNAMKYGAWSAPNGQVTFAWEFQKDGTLRLSWVERGGPVVSPPTRRGFGHVVIENLVSQSLGGEVSMDFDPSGLTWVLSITPGNLVG